MAKAGVVLIHEYWGVNAQIQKVAERWRTCSPDRRTPNSSSPFHATKETLAELASDEGFLHAVEDYVRRTRALH